MIVSGAPGCRGLTAGGTLSLASRRYATADIIDPGSCIEPTVWTTNVVIVSLADRSRTIWL